MIVIFEIDEPVDTRIAAAADVVIQGSTVLKARYGLADDPLEHPNACLCDRCTCACHGERLAACPNAK